MTDQTYENYWSFTAAFTDYNGEGFLTVLKTAINFIDLNKNEEYSEKKYNRLQEGIQKIWEIDKISIRKGVNQLVKMGFIESFLTSYNQDSIDYIKAKTNKKRESILSKIIYSKSSFNKAVNENSDLHQINFLINTLIENGKLSKKEIIALMLVDIEKIDKGFLNSAELNIYVEEAKKIDFIKRKYNQIGHLTNLLRKLDGIIFVNDDLYFTEDAKRIFGEARETDNKSRNPYLHLLYKNQLKDETLFELKKEQCMVEHLCYPILIASHIKPFVLSSEDEAYDPNNGLLLSKNLDGLFDHGLISFDSDGEIIVSKSLDFELQKHLSQYQLEKVFINEERKKFLQFHRSHFKDKLLQ